MRVPRVAAERLVAAVSREHYLNAPTREARHEIRRNRGGVGERFVKVSREFVEDFNGIRRDDLLDVARAVSLGYLAGVGKLAERFLLESHRKSLKRPLRTSGGECDHDA